MYRNFETERLLIRPIALDDKEFILQLLNTKGWLQFIGDRKVKDSIDATQYIKKILENDSVFYNVFELKTSKLPIGIVTFIYRDDQNFPDIGFAMLPNFEKQGLAFEATRRYLDEIIDNKITKKVIAITKPENTSSIRLIEKLGLKFEKEYITNLERIHLYTMALSTYT